MEKLKNAVEFAGKAYLRSIGGVTSCYPTGKGEALFADSAVEKAVAAAEADGWSLEPVPGVGRDMNFGGRLWRATRPKRV